MSFDILDTFIGLVSIYLVLSLIVSAIGKAISENLNFKGKISERIISNLLGYGLAKKLLAHESMKCLAAKKTGAERLLVRSQLMPKGLRSPSYIPPEVFAETLLDCLIDPTNSGKPCTPVAIDNALQNEFIYEYYTPTSVFADFKNKVISVFAKPETGATLAEDILSQQAKQEEDEKLRKRLSKLWREADFQPEQFKLNIIEWFDQTGDRSYGWYRRKLGFHLFLAGFLVSLLLNADSVQMFKQLSVNEELRRHYVDNATQLIQKSVENSDDIVEAFCNVQRPQLSNEEESTREECTPEKLAKSAFPEILPLVGWSQQETCIFIPWWACASAAESEQIKLEAGVDNTAIAWISKLAGFILTAIAISLGAPFWFDLLRKIIRVKGVITTRSATSSEASNTTKNFEENAPAPVPLSRTTIESSATDKHALDRLTGFSVDTMGYSPLNMYWSARLALLCYSLDSHVKATLEDFDAPGTLLEVTSEDMDTQCIVTKTLKAVFISFRGSEKNLQDWTTNSRVEQVPPFWDEKAIYKVHSGFNAALESIWHKLENHLEIKGIFQKGLPIWISGHSMGGALATLAGLKFAHQLTATETTSVIGAIHTFGQPRVGDKACAEVLDELFVNRYFRMINQRDVVPRLPPTRTHDFIKGLKSLSEANLSEEKHSKDRKWQVYDYYHAGRVIYYNDLGKGIIDPPMWYRKLDVLPVSVDVEKVKEAIKQTAGDHSMGTYLQLQRKLLDTE